MLRPVQGHRLRASALTARVSAAGPPHERLLTGVDVLKARERRRAAPVLPLLHCAGAAAAALRCCERTQLAVGRALGTRGSSRTREGRAENRGP